jgi:hypothetical protein
MPTTYTPDGATSTETIQVPNPGEEVTAASVGVFAQRLADRMKAIVQTVLPTKNFSTRALEVADNGNTGNAIHGISNEATGIGVLGTAPFGLVGTSTGDTRFHKAVTGLAENGEAVGVFAQSLNGHAIEAQGMSGGKALLSRGHIRFAQHTGASSQVNPHHSTGFVNTITARNTIKAWAHIYDNTIIDGFNIESIVSSGPYMRVRMTDGFPTVNYGVFVTSSWLLSTDPNTGAARFAEVRPFHNFESTGFSRTNQEFSLYCLYPFADLNDGGKIKQLGYPIDKMNFTVIVLGLQDAAAD